MAQTTADVLVERLIDWGVHVVFGLPGDGINGIMEALRTRQDRISFVQVRHEEAAAFMACGYAKYTGELGVCLATSGPGAIHLLNGLYDAKMDGAPVLAITGQTYHDLIGMHYQQEVDLLSLFKDVAVYNQQVLGAGARRRRSSTPACRTALSTRGVAHITCPVDIQEQAVKDDEPSTEERRRPHVGRVAAADRRSVRRRHPRRGRRAERRARRPSSSPARARSAPATSSSSSPTCWPRRSSSRCSARRSFPTTRRSRPAASACSAPSRRRWRWRSATRC